MDWSLLMSESKKPWENNSDVFRWYDEESTKSINLSLDEHMQLSIMDALHSIFYALDKELNIEKAKERLCLLAELLVSIDEPWVADVVEEVSVKLSMDHIDEDIQHLLEHHADEYKDNE